MSRSGYSDDCENLNLYRATVERAIRGKRGQAFLRELAEAMDAMPEKILISSELINDNGDCCAIGVICKARGIDVSGIDYEIPSEVADAIGIAESMAAEIEYLNDDDGGWYCIETEEKRWTRMRKWVADHIVS